MDEQTVVEESALDGKSYEELQAMLENKQQPEVPAESSEKADDARDADKSPEQKDEITSRLAMLEKRLADQQAFIDRQAQEIGLLRKENKLLKSEKEAKEPDVTEADVLSNPKETVSKLVEKALAKKASEIEEKNEALQETRARMIGALKTWVPDAETHADAVIAMMKRDGAPPDLIERYRSDPLGSYPPDVAYHMIKRALAEKKAAELEEKLNGLASKPGVLNRRLEEAVRRPAITGTSASKSGKSSPASLEGLTEEDIDKMSYEELLQLQKQL